VKCKTENCNEKINNDDLSHECGLCDLCIMDVGFSEIYACGECGEQFMGMAEIEDHWDDTHKKSPTR